MRVAKPSTNDAEKTARSKLNALGLSDRCVRPHRPARGFRSTLDGMRRLSRYLATVRRAMSMPISRRISAMRLEITSSAPSIAYRASAASIPCSTAASTASTQQALRKWSPPGATT